MAPPQPQSPSPTSTTQQFLSTVLSQRGPSSLPYTEDVKWLIRQHLLSLTDTCPSLSSKTAPFTHNDGRTVNLLQSYGTVPMVYQQVSYNIPVVIWLLESYPRHAPLVFVNPTRDMIVKHNHPFVNPSGIVSIPYLSNWVYPSSSLVELVRNLSHWFSNEPPLYSRTSPNPGPDTSPHPRPSASFWSSSGPGSNYRPSASLSSSGPARPVVPSTHPRPSTSFFSSGSAWPTIPPRVYPPSPYGSSGIGRRMDDPAEVFKKNAMENLEGKVCSDIEGLRKVKEVDMEGLLNVQGVLKQRKEELNRGVKEMLDEKEGLEQQLQMVLRNTDVLEGWVRDNEVKLKKIGDVNVDVDEAFEHCDCLSKQMSDCTASDLAMEDVIYSLDKAIQDGVIPFDQYLRNVRMLSREQFFQRATASKVRAAQIQDQVSNMASRLSQYALS